MSFIDQYFIQPIYDPMGGYNFVNTIIYAIAAIVILFGIYKILQKLNVHIDNKFFYAIFPFIILGSSLRTFVDSEIYKISFWTVSPGIYILTAAIFLGAFFASLGIERFTKIQYWKTSVLIGGGILILHFSLAASRLQLTNLSYGAAMLGLAAAISIGLFLVFKFAKFSAGQKYFLPFPAHMLDASTTFIAVDFLGAMEKHPLPALSTTFAGTAAIMYLLKLLVLIPLVYFLDKEFEDKNLVNYFIIAIAVLGFAEGIRNLLTIVLA